MAEAVIADGSAFAKCKEMFAAQGGDTRVLDDYSPVSYTHLDVYKRQARCSAR